MKKIFTLLLVLCFTFGYAQEKKITINHTVEYLIPSKRKNTTDTISIGFDKNGKYLWTDSKSLAKDLGKSIFKGNNELLNSAELNIILDTEKMIVILFFKSGENEMYMNLELSKIVPIPQNSENQEQFELISENTKETINIANRKAVIYDIYPSNEVNEVISIAFDESIAIDNNKLFKKFFELVFASEGSSSLFGMDFPNGLMMHVSNNGEVMMEANKVDTKTKTININYSFKISE